MEHTKGKLDTKEETDGHFGIYLKDAECDRIVVVWAGDGQAEANAKHLVRCWSCHEQLVAACEFAAKPEAPFSNDPLVFANRIIEAIQNTANAAIAAAKEKQ